MSNESPQLTDKNHHEVAQDLTRYATDDAKKVYIEWFVWLQQTICDKLEALEREYAAATQGVTARTFQTKTWQRKDTTQVNEDGGTGYMRFIEDGCVFEKGGVNVSTVMGHFDKKFAKEIPGSGNGDNPFWASGISLVIHPKNPYVPIVHMNTRHIHTGMKWFGGGADLTPSIPFDEDTALFHQAMKDACDSYSPTAYEDYKKWCDEYFYLKHRNEARGVGGIFFDNLYSNNPEADFDFLKKVGMAFIESYDKIVRTRMFTPYGEAEKEVQLKKRGRYVEFNLLYDRGTRFGLMTNGNAQAILMSLPPVATWNVAA